MVGMFGTLRKLHHPHPVASNIAKKAIMCGCIRRTKMTVEWYVIGCQLTSQARRKYLPCSQKRNGKTVESIIRQWPNTFIGFLKKETYVYTILLFTMLKHRRPTIHNNNNNNIHSLGNSCACSGWLSIVNRCNLRRPKLYSPKPLQDKGNCLTFKTLASLTLESSSTKNREKKPLSLKNDVNLQK